MEAAGVEPEHATVVDGTSAYLAALDGPTHGARIPSATVEVPSAVTRVTAQAVEALRGLLPQAESEEERRRLALAIEALMTR